MVPIDCNTLAKPCQVVYEETYYARDSGTLEQLKELSTKRQALEESINGSSRITPAIAREMAGGITSPILQVIFLWYMFNSFMSSMTCVKNLEFF